MAFTHSDEWSPTTNMIDSQQIIEENLAHYGKRVWKASKAYAAGEIVLPTSEPGALNFECTTAGTSGTTEPSWPTVDGNTISDGTVVWTARAAAGASAVSGGYNPGDVIFTAQNTPPAGFLKANGALVSRTTYADLFAKIGTIWGAGDGSTTFALPDLRGEFLRGWDDGRGVDGGRAFGSAQAMSTEGLFAKIYTTTGSTVLSKVVTVPTWSESHYVAGSSNAASSGSRTSATEIGQLGTGETKPRNVALLACIKY